MKPLSITSIESLEAAVAETVRKRIEHTQAVAACEGAVAALQKEYQPSITNIAGQIAGLETAVQDYCMAHREELFPAKKSRDTALAEFGFELTPHRVETGSKKIKWKDVLARLLRVPWGLAYVRQPEPQVDKQALLSDREKLTPEQTMSAGIQFCQDEQFFIRPKPETANLKEGK
jgi:phage host-nuclease inhibitor protein Gam